jgi:hypothetical protein
MLTVWGFVRDRGMVRASTTKVIFASRSKATKSSSERVECPMVRNAALLADPIKGASFVHGDPSCHF